MGSREASSSPSSPLDLAVFSNAVMDQLNCDARLKTSLLINDIIGLLILCRRNLTETERNLEEVDRKVDSLLNQFTGSHAPEFHDPFAPGDTATWDESTSLAPDPHQLPFNPTVPYSIPIQDGPIGLEELNRLGRYPQLVNHDLD